LCNRVIGKDFWYKTLPVLTIGMIIWVVITLLFSGLFGFGIYILTSLAIFIIVVILYIIFWIISIIFAFKKNNLISMLCFFIASFLSGILSSSLLIWASTIIRLELVLGIFFAAFFVGIGVTVGLLILGLFLREKISENWIYPLLVFGMLLVIIEFSLFLMFGYNPYILITSIFVLIWFFGVILWDGSRLPNTVEEGYWMLAVLEIFLDMINVIIRIFIIIVKILEDFVD
jgi:FtsH-binding integral membrane protein